jgi:hypothetical protein
MPNTLSEYAFPFGQKIHAVRQIDRGQKKVFVLGVYASAVHARWLDAEGKLIVNALAVASEPEIFWKGDEETARKIISTISIPPKLGSLTLPEKNEKSLNGPSGISLDRDILSPIKQNRKSTWLCDLLPESRLNINQLKAIYREYVPLMKDYDLPIPTVPSEPTNWTDSDRRREIVQELIESKADTIILLGDQPIKWFLFHLSKKWERLSDFGTTDKEYGRCHPFNCDVIGRTIQVLPLAHPRQTGKLGNASKIWNNLHNHWKNNCDIKF